MAGLGFLADPPEDVWIGTYGRGLHRWDRRTGRLGGGLARHARGAWQVPGSREGVPAADVPALSYAAPFLYLGSLGAGVTELREAPP
jgi:hypothetical protein